MDTLGYIRLAKRKLGIESDYALAARLGITRSSMSKLSLGKISFGDETCLKVAEILGVPAPIVLADIHAEREKNPEVAAAWRFMVEKLQASFEAIMLLTAPRPSL